MNEQYVLHPAKSAAVREFIRDARVGQGVVSRKNVAMGRGGRLFGLSSLPQPSHIMTLTGHSTFLDGYLYYFISSLTLLEQRIMHVIQFICMCACVCVSVSFPWTICKAKKTYQIAALQE